MLTPCYRHHHSSMIMTMTHATRRSPLALAILGLWRKSLCTYRMQQLIKARHKDDVINVRSRASLYQPLTGWSGTELVAVHGTSRLAGRPERTVYALTDAGRATFVRWLRRCWLPRPASSPSSPWPSRTSRCSRLSTRCGGWSRRAEALVTDVNQIEEGIALAEAAALPRLFLLEAGVCARRTASRIGLGAIARR